MFTWGLRLMSYRMPLVVFFLRSLPGRLAKEGAGSIAEGTHTREDLWREETETKQQTNKNMMQLGEASLIARVTPTPRWFHNSNGGFAEHGARRSKWTPAPQERNPFFFVRRKEVEDLRGVSRQQSEPGEWCVCVCVCSQDEAVEDRRVEWFDGKQKEFMFSMGGKGITGSVALFTGCSELFTAEENSNPAHDGAPTGSADSRHFTPTQDTERAFRLKSCSTDIWSFVRRI